MHVVVFLNSWVVSQDWDGFSDAVSPSFADLVTTLSGAVGVEHRLFGLAYANLFALVKSFLVTTRDACPRSMFVAGTDIILSLISSWNSCSIRKSRKSKPGHIQEIVQMTW